jgi:hypothetical protein
MDYAMYNVSKGQDRPSTTSPNPWIPWTTGSDLQLTFTTTNSWANCSSGAANPQLYLVHILECT